MYAYISHLPLLLVLDLLQGTDYGIDWLFSSLGVPVSVLLAAAAVGMAERCLRADSTENGFMCMGLLSPFQMCFTSPQPALPIFPEFCFCKPN